VLGAYVLSDGTVVWDGRYVVGAEDARGFIDPSLTRLKPWEYLPWWWFRFKEPLG
jgi:hypothetical protein